MMLLRLVSWPYFRKHALRSALTTLGVVLGVAVFVGMHVANRTVLRAFAQTVDRIAGKTELQVAAGDAGFSEDVLEQVQSARSVRIAVPVIEAIVESNLPGQGSLFVLAIDMTGDRSLRDYDLEEGGDAEVDDPLIFLAQPDSIILSRSFADRNQLTTGSRLTLGTAQGPKEFVVRGLMNSSSGPASAFAGNMVIMDIYAAQKMFGRGRSFDRIDIATLPGVSLAECQRELRALLGPAFDVQPPSGRGQQFEAMLAGYSLMMDVASAFALFIGVFIIYNAFSIAVTQRRTEIGILRALGAAEHQIRNLFLAEAAALGALGSLVGAAAGLVAARGLVGWLGQLLSTMYSVAQRVDELHVDPAVIGLAVTIGVATSLAGGWLPARQAAKLDPVAALQKGSAQSYAPAAGRARLQMAAAFFGIAAASLLATDRTLFYAGYASALAAMVAAAPALTNVLARALRPMIRRFRPVEGLLAIDSLLQAPRRTSGSVVALMLSTALVVAFAGMAQSSYGSIRDWMNTTLDPDLFVMPTPNLDVQTTRFPGEMQADLEGMPGVVRVQSLRNIRVTYRETPILLIAVEAASIAATSQLPPVAGRADEMYRLAAEGKGVLVSDTLALLQGLRLGDRFEVPAPFGALSLPIVGIVVDYSDQQGAVILDRSVYQQLWRDDTVNAYRVYTASTGAQAVRQQILDLYAGQRQVFVMTNAELKAYISRVAGQWFSLTWIQIAVAVLVAILGIANSLTVSIADRRKEFGVLRAVGALHDQIRHTIWIEAICVAVIGVILGVALGSVNLYYVLNMVERDVAGMRLSYELPLRTMLALAPAILAASFMAALWPAASAVRGSIVEALECE